MRSSVGAEMMIMVIMMMGDDQDMGLDPVQRRSVFSPWCVQMCSTVYSVNSAVYSKEAGTMRSVQSVTAGRQRREEQRVT